MFKSIPVMGQRDLTIKWAIGAGKAKEPLIEKGLIVDDGGAFFGWGVEQGHLGKTEIFCKFDPQNLEAKTAVETWNKEQSARAFKERYFAALMGPTEEIGPGLCNYHLWWDKITKSLDPNGVVPAAGVIGEAMVALVLADAMLEKFGGDNVKETVANYKAYMQTIGPRGGA
jgi:hypothetical protein